MKLKKLFFFLLSILFFTLNHISAQNAEIIPPIKYEEFKLKNGLRVILHQDKSTPVVAVNVWYHVGGKNEVAGRRGFAHLFEHMMFQGSKNYDANFNTPIEKAGASFINGVTTLDGTNYVETVPSNFLELALYMEAGRMGGLLEAMTQEKLDNQREVVKNERRQSFENEPYNSSFIKILEELFPPNHPYHWHQIGTMEDISAANLNDVETFFRQYYVPNNAILSIAGDFDEKQTRIWIEKYFGSIARGADIIRPNPSQPKLNGEIRRIIEDDISLPRLYIDWLSVPKYSSEEAAIDLLANILSTGRGSRLQGNLVFEKQIVQDVVAFNVKREIAGYFQIQATARPEKSLDEIEREINSEVERIKKEPPTAEEMNRALNQIESAMIFDLQTVLTKGDLLSEYAGFLNKPDYFQANLNRYRKVTAADVQKAANNYLNDNRLVMSYVPRRKGDATQKNNFDDNSTPTKSNEIKKNNAALIAKQTAKLPKPGPNPKLGLPPIEKAKLSNGLEVWMVRQNELPIVSMNMVFKSGITSEPAETSGVAAMTVSLLRSGTKTHGALDISNALQSLGVSITPNLGWDWTTVSTQTLLKNLDRTLDIYADEIVNPTFPESELESVRRRTLSRFVQRKSEPNSIANTIFNRVIYGTNPYGRPFSGTENSVKTISRDDLIKYYETTYRPNNAVLIVVGDVEKNSLLPKLEKAFGGWKSGIISTGATEPPVVQSLSKTAIYLVDKPGSVQSTILIGQTGISRSNPDFFATEIINSMLGLGVGSRINRNLRESKGYTYEASSSLTYFKNAGHFTVAADVQTGVTKESVIEFIKELNGIRGAIPVTQKELDYNKQSIIRRFPSNFETVGQVSFQLANLVIYDLPDSYFNDYIQKVDAVTVADVNRAANKYLTPDKMAIIIVGDRKAIESGLKQLGYPITILDNEGNAAKN